MPSQHASSFWQSREWNYNKHSLGTYSNYQRRILPNLHNYVLSAFLPTFPFGFRHFFFFSLCDSEYCERKMLCFSLEASEFHWEIFAKILENSEIYQPWFILCRDQAESHLIFSGILDLDWWVVWVVWLYIVLSVHCSLSVLFYLIFSRRSSGGL